MKLVVGLGNPGKEYDKTRHNVGFMVIDNYICHLNISDTMWKKKFNSLYLQTDITLYQSLEDASKKQVMSDLKIIQKGLKELDYNVNYKLWLDSMFAKLIGGGSND